MLKAFFHENMLEHAPSAKVVSPPRSQWRPTVYSAAAGRVERITHSAASREPDHNNTTHNIRLKESRDLKSEDQKK